MDCELLYKIVWELNVYIKRLFYYYKMKLPSLKTIGFTSGGLFLAALIANAVRNSGSDAPIPEPTQTEVTGLFVPVTPGAYATPTLTSSAISTPTPLPIFSDVVSGQPMNVTSCFNLQNAGANLNQTVQSAIDILTIHKTWAENYPGWRLAVARDAMNSVSPTYVNDMPLQTFLNTFGGYTYKDNRVGGSGTLYSQICGNASSSTDSGFSHYFSNNFDLSSLVQDFGHNMIDNASNIASTLFSYAGMAMTSLYVAKLAYDSYKATEMTAKIYGRDQVFNKAWEALTVPYIELARNVVEAAKNVGKRLESYLMPQPLQLEAS